MNKDQSKENVHPEEEGPEGKPREGEKKIDDAAKAQAPEKETSPSYRTAWLGEFLRGRKPPR